MTYSKSVDIDPADFDKSLKAVIGAIIFYTKDGDELIKYERNLDEVVLTFEADK